MPANNLFYQYYDVLYSDKKYEDETEYLFALAKSHILKPVEKVLETGCGTGNHSLEIAKHCSHITAIDNDKNMAEIAKEKIRKHKLNFVNIEHTEIENLNEKGFDLALAMFNVITYIKDTKSMLSFFSGIHQRLNKNGLFIFDCWNGLAALLDPPKIKTINKETAFDDISCKIISDTNLWEQKTTLNYFIQVRSIFDNTLKKDSFSFDQTLWTPIQIEYCLEESSFEILKCGKLFNVDEKATHNDWKIMYVCKAK